MATISTGATGAPRRRRIATESGQVRVSVGHEASEVLIDAVRPSPENDRLYKPVDERDSEFRGLVASIRQLGLLEPIVATLDGWIVSGHRRYAACRRAGLTTVPVRFIPVHRDDDVDRFVKLLREYNRQRVKSHAERIREEVVTTDPEVAYRSLIAHRLKAAQIDMPEMDLGARKDRSTISRGKMPMVDAVLQVLRERRKFWPLSLRAVHYALVSLPEPPPRHAARPDVRYDNNLQCYKDLSDLVTRARLSGVVPWVAITDETRPVSNWRVFREPGLYARDMLDGIFKDYWRDLMQSQPNHLVLYGEKLTLKSILDDVAMRYCIPVIIGRGQCSIDPRHELAESYYKSGKEKLVVLLVTDFDPDGEAIATAFARSMRDDFGINGIHASKVALTAQQVQHYGIPLHLDAKESSANYRKFADQYGSHAAEVEALAPETLQAILTEAIDAVLDRDAFNYELEQEKADALKLTQIRQRVIDAIGDAAESL